MKKSLFFYFILIFFFFLNYSKANIGFIDINYLLQESKQGKKLINELNLIKEKNESMLKTKQNELENEKNNLNKIKNIIPDNEFQQKVSDLKIKIDKFNSLKNDNLISFEEIKKQKLDSFFMNLNEILGNYVDKNDIKIIVDKKNIIIAEQSLDLTNVILNLIDKEN